MKTFFGLLLFLLVGAEAQPLFQRAAGHVIMVSIDGLAAYHLRNKDLALPNIRALIDEGAWAESSETVFPSVTHPAHTTIITGVPPRVHGVLSNNMKNRRTGESFHPTNKPRSESIAVPTLFDAARKRNLITASFFWPETKADASIDYNLPETLDSGNNADIRGAEPKFLEMLRAAGIPIDMYYAWYRTKVFKGSADAVLAQAAVHVIRTYKPRLLAIHLLASDDMQHSYGPDHYLALAALTNADHCVGLLREAVKEAGIAGQTTFFIVADHGFHTVRQEVNVYPLFKEAGLAERVRLHPGGWSLSVETSEKFNPARDSSALEKVFAQVKALPGVARIVRPGEFHALGQPEYEESPYIQGQYMIIADIDTHLVSNPAGNSTQRVLKKTPYHGHGYLPDHPRMHPALVLSGHRIKRAVRLGHTSNYDIAPTISYLLDLGMTGLTGRVLKEALAP